jgi:transposase
LSHPEPPGYRLKEPRPKPKIGPYLERIAQIIEEDRALPKKQHHTAKRIYERLREMGYGGKYTQVKEAARELLRVKQEVFMPLVHRVGEVLLIRDIVPDRDRRNRATWSICFLKGPESISDSVTKIR